MQIFDIVEELEKERKKNKELEERIDKVIEYIETDLCPNGSYCVNGSDLPYDAIEPLLNILKGDTNE